MAEEIDGGLQKDDEQKPESETGIVTPDTAEKQRDEVREEEKKVDEKKEEKKEEKKVEEKKPEEKEEAEEEKKEEIKKEVVREEKPVRRERKKLGFKFNFKIPNKKLLMNIGFVIVLILIVYMAVWMRTQNVPYLKDVTTGEYTLGPDLDPFLFLRHAKEIVSGRLQDPDMMRQAPLGAKNFANVNIMSRSIVFVYKLFMLGSVEFAAIIAPVLFFALTLLVFFFFIRKLFSLMTESKKATIIALIATAFYAVIPAMLHRTVAGVPELESLGMLWFWAAFLCFLLAWQSDKIKKIVPLALLAGIFTGLMSITWGGYKYIFMVFSVTSFLIFLFNKEKRKNFLIFIMWLVPAIIFSLAIGVGFRALLTTFSDTGLALMVFLALLIDTVLFNTKLKKIKEKIKLPESIIALIVTVVVGILILVAFLGPSAIPQTLSRIVEGLLYPFGRTRVGLTVAENRAPYFVEVLGSFTKYFFWIFFFGTIFLFYEATKHFKNKKNKIWLNLFFILFLVTFIFSRISPQSLLNGENFMSRLFYFGGLLLFAIVLLFIYIRAHVKKDEKSLEDFKKIDVSYLLTLVFIFWMIVSMRGAVRLFFIISPALIIAASFLPIKLGEYSFKTKDNLYKILLWAAVILVVILLIVTFVNYYRATSRSARYTIPGSYYHQWQKAMGWVRENTAEDAIFTHWWDYGYWVQSWGERATVTDGGHANGFWDHMVARYLMTAESEKTALQFCKAHEVSYFLIDSSDIGKYPAYSSIGSDASGVDRLSWVNTFRLDEKQTQETRNESIFVYVGGTYLDADIEIKGQLFPRGKAAIGGFVLSTNKEKGTINSLNAILFYNNKQETVPLRYLYINGEFRDVSRGKEAINGALYIIPSFSQQKLSAVGAALYLSERAINTQWVRLYLLDETENFELVHSEDALVIEQMKQANITTDDIILVEGGLNGPIKIWKVNYPEEIEFHEGYLKSWSDWEQQDKPVLDYLGT